MTTPTGTDPFGLVPNQVSLSQRTETYVLPEEETRAYRTYYRNLRDFHTQTAEAILDGKSLETIKVTDLTSFQREALLQELQRIQNREKEVQEVHDRLERESQFWELSLREHLERATQVCRSYLTHLLREFPERPLDRTTWIPPLEEDMVYVGLGLLVLTLFLYLLLH